MYIPCNVASIIGVYYGAATIIVTFICFALAHSHNQATG